MAPVDAHAPHCRFCANVAHARNNGQWVCVNHQNYVPWGAAVLAHLRGTTNHAQHKGEKK